MWVIYFETDFGWRETRAKSEGQARAWVQNYESSVGLDAYYERI